MNRVNLILSPLLVLFLPVLTGSVGLSHGYSPYCGKDGYYAAVRTDCEIVRDGYASGNPGLLVFDSVLAVCDFPLSLVGDTVLAPFIATGTFKRRSWEDDLVPLTQPEIKKTDDTTTQSSLPRIPLGN